MLSLCESFPVIRRISTYCPTNIPCLILSVTSKVNKKNCYITLITTSFTQYIYKNKSKLISFSLDSWLHRPHPCFVRNKLLIEKQLIIYLSSQLTLLLLALSSAALDGHQSLADGALPGRPVLSGHHAVHQRGRHHLEGVAAVARRQGHGELGGASDLQHLGQSDLLRGRGGETEFHHFYRKSQKSGHVCVSRWGALPCSTWCCSRSGTEWCSSSPGSSSDASSENTHISNNQVLKGAICQTFSWNIRFCIMTSTYRAAEMSPEVSMLTG